MNNVKLNKISVAIILSMTLLSNVHANEDNISADIPVTPINAERIAVEMPKLDDANDNTPVATAVDDAMMEALTKSLPKESVAIAKSANEGKTDLYGRPINPTEVITKQSPERIALPGTTASSRAGKSTPITKIIPDIAGRDPVVDQVREKYKPNQKLNIEPGNSELIPVAMGLQNRIATKFNEAEVKTSDVNVPIEVIDGIIYITPISETPIGLMIGERGMPETMVSLTLMPLDVPPVMVELTVDMPKSMQYKHAQFVADKEKEEAKKRRRKEVQEGPIANDDPRVNTKHVERATNLLTEVAAGEIPLGFDLDNSIPEDERYPCDIRKMGMYHEVGQRMTSGREIIDVVRIENDINGFREVREEFCLGDDVIAVGVFDKATLAPGEETELYILRDKLYSEKKKRIRARPRLTSSN